MKGLTPDPGSFRDPGNRVFSHGERILRLVRQQNTATYRAAAADGIYERMAERGYLLPLRELSPRDFPGTLEDGRHVLEHPRIPFISYPYEWSFALHREAALLHLDLHLEALKAGYTLSDASAYNVQFRGTRPVFIDHLSLRPYRDGELWAGHRQFCMQFLNPLIMWSALGLTPNHWFRGSLEGISPEELAPLLPLRSKLSWTRFAHVVAQASLHRRHAGRAQDRAEDLKARSLPRQAFSGMLQGLRNHIAAMRPPSDRTVWADYAGATSYSAEQAETKRAFVQEMVSKVKPGMLFDLGCNTGDYSLAALEAGADQVVGFDFDHATLDRAFDRFRTRELPFLPLWMDAANPSPSQGWAQAERRGLTERAGADALVALAFIHHIAIGRNVPLPMAVEWIMGLAPTGIIEFPPKSDLMVRKLLALREDIFDDYGEEQFLAAVSRNGRVAASRHVVSDGRLLVWYER